MDWPIAAEKVIERFKIDDDLGGYECRERHPFRSSGFDEDSGTEVEGRERHLRFLSALVV